MSDSLSSVTVARSELARLHVGNPNPDPAELRRVNAKLACAKIDARIREALSDAELNDVQVAHLVGLLLANAGVSTPDVGLFEKWARECVKAAKVGESE